MFVVFGSVVVGSGFVFVVVGSIVVVCCLFVVCL